MPVREIRQPGDYCYTYGPHHPPVAEVGLGEKILIHTVDAFGNTINRAEDRVADHCHFPFVNPQTGPILVTGAKKGDTLIVRLHGIEPARDFAVTALIPRFGALTSTSTTATLNEPLPEQTRILPIRDGRVIFSERITLPYEPFVGTIGVAPEIESISSLVPGYWGGNMDCPQTCPGNEIHFPVLVDGRDFFIGDAHACQGDGEITGCGGEMPARVTLSFDLIKGKSPKWPRIISPDHLMTVGAARPLEDAARIAWVELVEWLAADHGFDRFEAYHLLGQTGRMRLGNMVDPSYTMVAMLPRQYLATR